MFTCVQQTCCEVCAFLMWLLFQSPVTLEFIKTKRELCCPNTCTFPMSAPNADGETAAIVCSEQFVNRHNLQVTSKYVFVLSLHVYCTLAVIATCLTNNSWSHYKLLMIIATAVYLVTACVIWYVSIVFCSWWLPNSFLTLCLQCFLRLYDYN